MPNRVNNQKLIKVHKEPTKNAIHAQINMEALEASAQRLQAGAFKLWVYMAKNQNNYEFALSSKDCNDRFGIGIKQYNNAVAELKEKGYLVEIGKDIYVFNEVSVITKGNNENEEKNSVITKGNNAVITKGYNTVITKGNNELLPKEIRNITDNTNNNTSNITDAFDLTSKSNGGDVPEEEEIGTLDNPILVSMEWLAERHNLIQELTNKRWQYGDKIYAMKQ